jgi:hypothetical protein
MDARDQHVTVNAIIDRILQTTTFISRDQLRGLEWALNEITDNVLVHSENSCGGVIQLTHKPKQKEIEFVVCDSGVGIPQSLRHGVNAQWSDEIALEQSIMEGVTRGTGQGNGLFRSIRIAEASGGTFSINSGQEFLALTRNGEIKIRADDEAIVGTCVDCSFSYAKPLVLERALSFEGGSHIPMDMIDFKYSAHDGIVVFDLSAETASIGSRGAGHDARRKLENVVAMSQATMVAIGCGKLSIMSSSFADEFFAKLILRHGVDGFCERFTITELSETNVSIISRSVFQRTGESFSKILDKIGAAHRLRESR